MNLQINSLKNLGLNIRRAKLTAGEDGAGGKHKFYITDARTFLFLTFLVNNIQFHDSSVSIIYYLLPLFLMYVMHAGTSEKVIKSAKIEEIRLTILNNMLEYHPESAEQLAWGSTATRTIVRDVDPTRPLGARPRSVVTQIEVRDAGSGAFTEILVNTLDRPGLLTDIVRVLKDINLNVISAEVDTIGRNAVDTFNVTYHGEPLPEPMCQLAMNALQYYLSQGEIEKEWSESY